jgi:ribonuclease HI
LRTVIVTDGSADNRTGHGGWGVVVQTPLSIIEACGHTTETTSNRMELRAAIEGIKLSESPVIELVSDSAYLLNTLKNRWYVQWFLDYEAMGHIKTRPNIDLWLELVELVNSRDVVLTKVRGHSGDYWNERVDKLAVAARRNSEEFVRTIPNFSSTEVPLDTVT